MKKGLLVLSLIFCLIYMLNLMTPLLSDDYFNSFVWPEGIGMHGVLPENAKRVSSFSDIIDSLKVYYFTWGGRLFGQFLIDFFVWKGKLYFNIVNALMTVLLIVVIYWISHEGYVTASFNWSYIFWIFFSLWAFNVGFIDTFLWLSGSCDYLWPMAMLLIFLLPYIRNYYDRQFFGKNKLEYNVCLFLLGVVSGCSRETLVCWIVLILAYWLFLCKKSNNLQSWKIFGFVGLCIGYGTLLFAPGNIARLELQQNASISVFMDYNILSYKLIELGVILFFHLFLWYYIISFFFRYKRLQIRNFISYLNIAKVCVFIALVSGILLFLSPSRGIRLSFPNLVFLIIAAASLFRVQEINGVSLLNKKEKKFLSLVGCIYLFFTITVSLWGNYVNWCHWNDVLSIINLEQKYPSKTVLQIEPCLTEKNNLWFYSSGFFHIVGYPVHQEVDSPLNRTFSKYYNIKGIRVVNNLFE